MKQDTAKTDLVARTLWQVETDLAHAPTLEALARALGVSRFHLTRAFALRTGQSLMAYVRARRLSEAARALAHPAASVIEAGLDAGYDSAAGFARAFRSRFGLAPSDFRSSPDLSSLNLQEPLTMSTTSVPVSPRIAGFPGLKLSGRSKRFTLDTRARIPAFWEAMAAEHGAEMLGHETFGVCSDFDDDGSFAYFIGVDPAALRGAEDVAVLELPAGTYAVFAHEGHVATIGDTWDAVFSDWAPRQSEWALADGPEFERYEIGFDPATPGGVAVWIPIKRA